MTHVSIRTATPADCPSINHLSAQLGYPVPLTLTTSNLEFILNDPSEIVFVAELKNQVVGWIYAYHAIRLESSPYCEIGGLIVDETYRGQQIGKQLVEQVAQWAAQKNVAVLKVRSNVVRKGAHRFYLERGFTEKKQQIVFERKLS